MKYLFLLNDAPCGNERSYNALRLARSLLKSAGEEVKVFLIGTMDGLTAWTRWADKVIVV
jgi:sulfur relay (sulfurtransferase) complex TusBCD TusD component (DsrE family)